MKQKKSGSSEKDICISIQYFSVYIDIKIVQLALAFTGPNFSQTFPKKISENILFLTSGESGPY